jgi:anti-anti-sigma regulatory factor
MDYGISIGSRGEWIIVRLTGKLDHDAAHQLHLLGEPLSYMDDLPVEFDLRRVASIDSDAIEEIEAVVLELLDAGRDVRLVNAADDVRGVLEPASEVLCLALAELVAA